MIYIMGVDEVIQRLYTCELRVCKLDGAIPFYFITIIIRQNIPASNLESTSFVMVLYEKVSWHETLVLPKDTNSFFNTLYCS